MPKIDVSHKDLCNLIGRKLSVEQLSGEVLYAKSELDEANGDTLKIDVKDTNRPDLWSTEGIAREIRGHYKPGMPKYTVRKSGLKVIVDSSVASVRPYTACAIVKGLKITETVMSQLLQLQEKVAGTFGRNRRDCAIGIYDFEKIKFPITFKAMKPDQISFVPLNMNEKLTARQIIDKHPKGKEFGHLLHGDLYPVFVDANNDVLSVPPIVNSNSSGNVSEKTTDLFIECSGSKMKFLATALNVIVTALAERGGQIYSIEVIYDKKSVSLPDLSPKKFSANHDHINRITGLDLTSKETVRLLEQASYSVTAKGNKLNLLYPAYRQDLMHERDVVEDILISYNFNKIEPETPKLVTKGTLSSKQIFAEKVAELMTGAGFQEILSYTLTNKENLFSKMNVSGTAVEIDNPMSANWSVLRTWLLPGLLEFLSKNMHVEYPHIIFETGNIVQQDNSETRATDILKLAAAISASSVNYETISSSLDALLSNLEIEYTLKKVIHSSFIDGRCAEIIASKRHIGFIGEINPAVLNNWSLEKPVVAFEINLEDVLELTNKGHK